jgi:hypothetical protein
LYNEASLTEQLEETLEVLKLTSRDLTWFNEIIKLQPHELWRQDGNGHKFLIKTFPCKADAVKVKKEFECHLHKQTYSIKKVEVCDKIQL